MDPGRIPKDILYGELAEGTRPTGRPRLRYKDVCKRDMKTANIDVNQWESFANDRPIWRLAVKQGVSRAEDDRNRRHAQRRARRKEQLTLELRHRLTQTDGCQESITMTV